MIESTNRKLARVVRQLSYLVQHAGERRDFTLYRSSRSLPLIYAPRLRSAIRGADDAVESRIPLAKDVGGPTAEIRVEPAFPKDRSHLPVNTQCSLCAERIYAVRRYRIEGRLPILFLRYSYPLDEKSTPHPDRSSKHLFATAEEENLFLRMLQAAGLSADDLHFQEFPACHFDPRSLPEDWNRRTRNCLEHVQTTVRERGIRQILVAGNAAVLLFGERAARLAETGELVSLDLLSPPVPVLVLRSPAALVAMEKQRIAMEKSLERFPEEAALYETFTGKSQGKGQEFRRWVDEALVSLSPLPDETTGAKNSGADVRVIASVKLKSAASIKPSHAKGDAEFDRFRAAGREGAGLLVRLQRLRENETKVKRQILDVLRKMKAEYQSSQEKPSV